MHIMDAEMERGMVCTRARQQQVREPSATRLPRTPSGCCQRVPPLGLVATSAEESSRSPSRGEETEAKSPLHLTRQRQTRAAFLFCPGEVKKHRWGRLPSPLLPCPWASESQRALIL